MKPACKLLASLLEIVSREGTKSQAVKDFIEVHRDNQEFVDLANYTLRLKDAISD